MTAGTLLQYKLYERWDDSITIPTTDENGNDAEIPFRYSKDRIQ